MARERKQRRRSISDLIGAKEYAEAIEVLREELAHNPLGVQRRLQLADLLLLAGRREEALPILMSLAEELLNDGFVAKAVAIWKRVDRLDPGRPEVEERLERLAHRPPRPPASAVPLTPPPPPAPVAEALAVTPPSAPAATPIAEEAMAVTPLEAAPAESEAAPTPPPDAGADASAPPPAETEADAGADENGFRGRLRRLFRGRGKADEVAPAALEAAPAEAPATTAETESVAPSGEPLEIIPEPAEATGNSPLEASAAAVDVPAEEPPPADARVADKLGGVFRRFLAGLPGTDESPEPELAARDFATALAAVGLDGNVDDDDEGEILQAFIDDEDLPFELTNLRAKASEGETPPAAETEAGHAAAPAAPPARRAQRSPITEEAFKDQVLDLLEEVLKQPVSPGVPAAPPRAAASEQEQEDRQRDPSETTEPLAVAYRDELLAHPLFVDLSPDEMLAMLRALRLVCADPGEVIVSEGEAGASLFLIIGGSLRLHVRNPAGHNVEVGRLNEGAFFGEMSLLSGKPRNATITAATRAELLELPKTLLDGIAVSHPRVRDIVDELYLQRASNEGVAAVRTVPLPDSQMRERAKQVLRSYFGGRRFEPRMQLKLATVLVKAGKVDEAVPILVALANELLREGDTPKAIAILKKVEMIRTRSLQVVNLAPLLRDDHEQALEIDAKPAAPSPRWSGRTQAYFSDWLVGAVRRSVVEAKPAESSHIPGYGPELVAHPLFEGFSEEELLALVRGLRLSAFDAGEIILTEGEPGDSVFILSAGTVKVFVRNLAGRDQPLCELGEGAFFGEISTLTGRPRSATVIAATRCELLELDRPTLDRIADAHPRVRQIMEDVYIERATSPQAATLRTSGAPSAGEGRGPSLP